MSTRTERDTMGEMQVPANALYGAQTARAVANFPISGRGIGRPMIRALGRIRAAAAVDNFRAKLLSGLEVDRERVAALNERSLALATGLVPLLGYDRAAAIVKEAWSTNRTIREVALARGVASAEDLDRLLDLRAQTEPGRGGSGRGR